ncbi:DUF4136 domain-containing protein [Pyxidicoccus trucidator]|uniref:DUF4136 domain-containing protein n=1 Tax=Pyxidicoccus trucidator TaxID=2709662 RepID=UPI0013DBA0C2|nr:DUF4136 domain-containing protein [Pyxidicoccus trucidator]
MSPHHRLAVPLLLLLLAACSGIETNTHYDPASVGKLDGYKTYAWLPAPEGADPRIYNDVTEAQVKKVVDAQLASRGYRKVDENPDFKFGWHGSIDQKMDVDTVNSYYGYGWGSWYAPYGPGMSVGATFPQTYVDEYEEGTLILDVVDAGTNKLVWRGTAQAALEDNPSPQRREERLGEAVKDVLEQFPPKGK